MTHANDLANQPLNVAPALAKKLDKLGLRRRFDLVLHLPLRYEDETHLYPIAPRRMASPFWWKGGSSVTTYSFAHANS
jgi:ATP-dependent DNA helicase RecG